MSIDLDNLSNMYLLTYTSDNFNQLSLYWTETIGGIKCKIYRHNSTLIVTFSPFNCDNCLDYFRIGGKIVWQQDMIDCGVGKMNRFFHNVSKEFADRLRLKNPKFSNLIISGMSMGAALGQCFYYHFRPSVKTTIHAFGSPRVGDSNLRNWFQSQKKLKITNYALFKLVNNVKKIDPVCLFPSCRYGPYVNNANMTMLYDGKIINQAEYSIDGPDTDITLMSIISNCGLDKNSGYLWDLIHDTDEYYYAVSL